MLGRNQVDRWYRSCRNSGGVHTETLHNIQTQKDLEADNDNIKYDKATDLKIGQLVLIRNNTGVAFDPKYLADHRVV